MEDNHNFKIPICSVSAPWPEKKQSSMPALTINTFDNSQLSSSSDPNNNNPTKPPSPTAPPYSPITPVLSTAALSAPSNEYPSAPPSNASQQPLPPLLPISESDNPDAIALRSALSILQIQRQQSLRDLKALEQMKKEAVADPQAFAQAVKDGKVKTASSGALIIGQDFDTQAAVEAEDEDMDDAEEHKQPSKFTNIPGPQNIVRCPPINWAKYHVVGDSLDILHEEQRNRPSQGQVQRDGESLGARAPEAVIAAPYSPFTDTLGDEGVRARRGRGKEG